MTAKRETEKQPGSAKNAEPDFFGTPEGIRTSDLPIRSGAVAKKPLKGQAFQGHQTRCHSNCHSNVSEEWFWSLDKSQADAIAPA